MDSDSHIYGLLGRIHVLMRRALNRITDVEYMRINADYAREIVRIAEAVGNAEMNELCAKLRVAMELDGPPEKKESKRSLFGGSDAPATEGEDPERYIRSLR
jgi:hypothetical protein